MTNNTRTKWQTGQLEFLATAGFNWDSFADLLTGFDTCDIASDLLYLDQIITTFHAQTSNNKELPTRLSEALNTLRELHKAFGELGKTGEGTLKLTLEM